MKGAIFLILGIIILLALGATVHPAEKLKFGTAIKEFAGFYLPIFAAAEKGFWKENNLEVEWIPFRGGAPQLAAVAAGEIMTGFTATSDVIQGASRGLPVLIVSELWRDPIFSLWVRTDSRIKEPRDLKGAKLGVSRLGSPSHIYGQMVGKVFGLEKDVRFVAAGGVTEIFAAMKAGHLDGTILSPTLFIDLQLKGEVREVFKMGDYLSKDWLEFVVFAQKEFSKKRADTARRTVRAVIQAIDFINKTPRWAMDKMKAEQGYSEEATRQLYERLSFSKDGKIREPAVINNINMNIDYGIVPRDKVPPVGEIYTREFTG